MRHANAFIGSFPLVKYNLPVQVCYSYLDSLCSARMHLKLLLQNEVARDFFFELKPYAKMSASPYTFGILVSGTICAFWLLNHGLLINDNLQHCRTVLQMVQIPFLHRSANSHDREKHRYTPIYYLQHILKSLKP